LRALAEAAKCQQHGFARSRRARAEKPMTRKPNNFKACNNIFEMTKRKLAQSKLHHRASKPPLTKLSICFCSPKNVGLVLCKKRATNDACFDLSMGKGIFKKFNEKIK